MPNSAIVSAKGAGLVKGGVASPESYNSQDYNGFDRSMISFETQRFAEINPIFSKKFISGDRVRIRSTHELRTFTFKSPLMSNVYMHRAFFQVPLQCIYHNTFKPFFINPVKGNDIPDSVKPSLNLNYIRGNSSRSLYLRLLSDKANVSASVSDDKSVCYLLDLFLLMQIYSKDGLLQKLGYSVTGNVDQFYKLIIDDAYNAQGFTTFRIGFTDNTGTACSIDFFNRQFVRGGGSWTWSLPMVRGLLYDLVNNKYEITSFFTDAFADESFDLDYTSILNGLPNYSDEYINLEKLIAYQYVCAQYYTNSFVDDIHDARSWEMNILSTLKSVIRNSSLSAVRQRPTSFILNGVSYEFDLVNRQTFDNLFFIGVGTSAIPFADTKIALSLLRNIFEVHYSLRTSDYFLDSRTQPLAVGNVDVQVNNNLVNAIDINISLWRQRFLNAVNRVPYHIETYLNSVFGFTPETKEPKPYYLTKERFFIGKQEIENTSNTDQGKIVSQLRTEDSRYFFETRCSEPCIIIGLNSYSLEYAYASAMDKEFLEFDRFDNFNPYMQHSGDQALLLRELDNNPNRATLASVFGYQVRYQQYKKSINHVSGGFISKLPSWVALFDKTGNFGRNSYLNSDFIRNHNEDFDGFYSSLTGSRPDEYFHFICRFDTLCHVNSKQQKYPSLV